MTQFQMIKNGPAVLLTVGAEKNVWNLNLSRATSYLIKQLQLINRE